jgi:hypothetical protein
VALLTGRVQGSLLEPATPFFEKNRRKGGRRERRLGRWRELSPPLKIYSIARRRQQKKFVAKGGPHALLSFRLRNPRSPSVSNHSPSAPAYSPNSEIEFSQNSGKDSADKLNDFSRRIETLQQNRENSFKLRPVEQPTIQEIEISTLPEDITGNTHFYRTYGNKAIYEVPLEELAHEVVFLRLLNKLSGLSYNTIKAAVRFPPPPQPNP